MPTIKVVIPLGSSVDSQEGDQERDDIIQEALESLNKNLIQKLDAKGLR